MKLLLVSGLICASLFLLTSCAKMDLVRQTTSDLGPEIETEVVGQTTRPASAREGRHAYAEIFVAQGDEHYKNDRNREADEAYRQAIRLDPDYADAHYKSGLALSALGEREPATGEYRKAAELCREALRRRGTRNAPAYLTLARVERRLGRYVEAVEAYRRSVKDNAGDAEAHYELGMVFLKLGKTREAAGSFKRAIRLNPDDYRARGELERLEEEINGQEEGAPTDVVE